MKKTELKSRVMNLGNRLAPRIGGGRATAFEKAWAIIKVGGMEPAVNRPEELKRLAAYSPAEVRAAVVTAMGVNPPALREVSGMGLGARVALGV